MMLYFAQRGPWRGHWRRVPMQSRFINWDLLRTRLTARGHIVRIVP